MFMKNKNNTTEDYLGMTQSWDAENLGDPWWVSLKNKNLNGYKLGTQILILCGSDWIKMETVSYQIIIYRYLVNTIVSV